MASRKVSVIIVSYFVRDEVRECLRRLREIPEDIEVFVVDNGSTDGTREMLRDEFGDWNELHPMLLDENIGLAAANNVPIDRLQGEYVLILNPDTLPTAPAMRQMIHRLDSEPHVAVVGPRQLYDDGTPHSSFHHRCWGMAHMALFTLFPRSLLRYWYDRPGRLKECDAGFVSGACLMMRTEVYRQIGGYDDAFFLCAEDTADLCRRSKQLGHRVLYITDAEIVHYGARSYGHAKPFSLLKTCEGRLIYARKWSGAVGLGIVYAVVTGNSVLKFAIYTCLALGDRERYRPRAGAHSYVLRNLRPRRVWSDLRAGTARKG